MKWLLLLLVASASAAPSIAWEQDIQVTEVQAVQGVLAMGDQSWHYNSAGELQATLPKGTWAGALLGDAWYDLSGTKINDVVTPDFSHETGILSYNTTQKRFENGHLVNEWSAETCSGGTVSGQGVHDQYDLVYNQETVALYRDGLLWSISPGNVFSAGISDGVVVVFNDGRVAKYAFDNSCGGAPSWEFSPNKLPLKSWFGPQTYIQYNDTFFGSFLVAIDQNGAKLWEIPSPTIRALVQTKDTVIIASTGLKLLDSDNGSTIHQFPLSVSALANDGRRIYAGGAKLWAIDSGAPVESSNTESDSSRNTEPNESTDSIVIPAATPILFIFALGLLAKRR